MNSLVREIADFMTEKISAAGLPRDEWVGVVLDAENAFVAEHNLIPIVPDDQLPPPVGYWEDDDETAV